MIARRFLSASLAGVLAVTVPAFVAPVGAAQSKNQTAKKTDQKPKGATAQCEDGSYSTAKTQRGACSGHGGVKTWYSDSAASTPATPSSKASLSTFKARTRR